MIITVAFGKGGTGKSTTAAALVNYARMQGKSVLCVDADPQANATYALEGDPSKRGLFSVMTDEAHAIDVIQKTPQTDLISAGLNLAAAEQVIANKPGRDFILREALKEVRNDYDMIVIDTQPDLNSLLVNALSVSDTVLLPMQANTFSIMGLYQMGETIAQVKRYCNPDLTIAGIVLTRFKARQTLANDLRESIIKQAATMDTVVFDTYIREGVAVEQAQALQRSLFEYAPDSNPAKDYRALFEEMKII